MNNVTPRATQNFLPVDRMEAEYPATTVTVLASRSLQTVMVRLFLVDTNVIMHSTSTYTLRCCLNRFFPDLTPLSVDGYILGGLDLIYFHPLLNFHFKTYNYVCSFNDEVMHSFATSLVLILMMHAVQSGSSCFNRAGPR
jgi:hypothetical protein